MLCVEGLYAPRMYKRFQDWRQSPLMYGSSPARIFSRFTSKGTEGMKKLGLDFSGFDQKIPPYLLRIAFDILHGNVNWDTWRGKSVSPNQRQKWRNVWDGMVWYFINTPILMPDGRLFRKRRGVPSGSWWTSLVDSIVNYLVTTFLVLEQEEEIHHLMVLGDDSASHVRDFLLERGALTAHRCFGMVVNSEKSDLTETATDFRVLGTKYRMGRSFREDSEWFKLILYPEYPVRDLDTSMSRFVGLWLCGAMDSIRFCDFWRYFQSGYPVKGFGRFSRDQRRGLTALLGREVGDTWSFDQKVSIFEYAYHAY
jgi:hypothetical protein